MQRFFQKWHPAPCRCMARGAFIFIVQTFDAAVQRRPSPSFRLSRGAWRNLTVWLGRPLLSALRAGFLRFGRNDKRGYGRLPPPRHFERQSRNLTVLSGRRPLRRRLRSEIFYGVASAENTLAMPSLMTSSARMSAGVGVLFITTRCLPRK